MKKLVLSATCLCTLGVAIDASAQNQRKCGFDAVMNEAIANDPSFLEKFNQKLETRRLVIDDIVANEENTASKTTATPVIPVVFHIILNQQQINQLGGTAGIAKRVDSSIAVINRDFNRQNADSTLIPATFKSAYGSMNIRFGLAHRTPTNQSTPGYVIKTITTSGFSGLGDAYSTAKSSTSNGDNAWDASKYLNIWVINLTDASSILGITTPPGFGPLNERGVVLNYGAFGKRVSTSDYYIPGIDRGRTLTHELGHYFEVWHIWGDDNGQCPGSGGQDDGITDTPPQGNSTYSWTNPTYPETDGCSPTAPGIMFMNFMDYVDDAEMVMFTKKQAIAANSSLTSESNGLTQHPELLSYPTGISSIELENPFDIYPNPSNGNFNISFATTTEKLQDITVVNTVGQEVYQQATNKNTTIYNIDISGLSKGVYFVQCRFEEGTVTRKIVLQ